ncbi:MAG: hypothetical protein HY960_08075 [Ignavibacteriae bacterium]|nr:hypothetical protein [Ignavibacteriota bacterium]
MNAVAVIEEKIHQLHPEHYGEVEEFIDMFLGKQQTPKSAKLNPKWKGMLKDVRMSSVELQHKSLEWWSEECIL